MGHRTRLSDSAAVFVADASVAINLIASGCAAEVIAALPDPIVIMDVVTDELEGGQRNGHQDAAEVRRLVGDGLLEVRSLGPAGLVYLEHLVVGTAADTLDDGEAATVAYALEAGGVAVIDERKAKRICSARFPGVEVRCTVDLFAHPEVQRALGRQRLADAIFNALRKARMRVPLDQTRWVVDLIGPQRVAKCVSLPSAIRREVVQ